MVQIVTPRLTDLERLLGPSAPAWSRHILSPTLLRAPYCVPSRVDVRADVAGHGSLNSSGAALPIGIGAKFPIGPKGLFYRVFVRMALSALLVGSPLLAAI